MPYAGIERAERRMAKWEAGVDRFDAQLQRAMAHPHPFNALPGNPYCLDCGATVKARHFGRRIHPTTEGIAL